MPLAAARKAAETMATRTAPHKVAVSPAKSGVTSALFAVRSHVITGQLAKQRTGTAKSHASLPHGSFEAKRLRVRSMSAAAVQNALAKWNRTMYRHGQRKTPRIGSRE